MSEAVRAAQEKLNDLRRLHGAQTRGREPREASRWGPDSRKTNTHLSASASPGCPTPATIQATDVGDRGAGRHSDTLTRHLRAAAQRRAHQTTTATPTWWEEHRATSDELRTTNGEPRVQKEQSPPHSSLVTRHSSLIKVYPDVALAMLRSKTAAAGRVWLLLRHADDAGTGRIATTEAVRLLTTGGSPWHICGRRQLANLLRAGDGLYWQRDTGRNGAEWLRLGSAARVAAGLGVRRLGGSPVAVPLTALTGTIGQARAHLYAAFHSGRTRTDLLTGQRRAPGPIARATLCKLSGAAPNSQRNYERRARVGRRSAIAVGPLTAAADQQEVAWQRGHALFRLRDPQGRHGRPGAVYLAWQLPNEYIGPHATLPRGRQKRLNRALADLFHNGMTGNDERRMTNDELRMTNEEAAGGRRSGEQDVSGQWLANPRSVGSRSVGSKSVDQWTVDSGQQSMKDGHSSLVTRHSSPLPPSRRFYSTAKTAFLARHDGEKYWRYGDVWLWQAEIRDTTYEIRVKRCGGFICNEPQATYVNTTVAQPGSGNTGDECPVA
ncbi:MAG: hypothetical protein R3C43_19025 [Chloroflexota bacterium]